MNFDGQDMLYCPNCKFAHKKGTCKSFLYLGRSVKS